MQARDRLIVALDRSSRDDILHLADQLHGAAGALKIGLQAFVSNGPSIVREIVSRGERVFLDLKIHDIPNTAQHAVAEAAALGAAIVTVHTSGGEAMLRACAHEDRLKPVLQGAHAESTTIGQTLGGSPMWDRLQPVLVAGVTILTSLDETDLPRIGFAGTALENAVRLARLAQTAGLRAVVASPQEIAAIREACGGAMAIIAPGIRPAGSDAGDQRRTTTPAAAIAAGADYIVVGRPITDARDPRAAALELIESLP
jgi:orotidine-5'-phosphate decarboxylase